MSTDSNVSLSSGERVSWEHGIDHKGSWKREERTFRSWISANSNAPFAPESGRYHLYVSYACPWAQRTLIVRKLKGLEDVITVDVVHPLLKREISWSFDKNYPGTTGDTVSNRKTMKEIYLSSDPNYSGTFTVPVLYDKRRKTIVNNESSEIIRMLNSEFNEFAKNPKLDLSPAHLKSNIEEVNEWIYSDINNGVYKCGFAKMQEAYEDNFHSLFSALDRVEEILRKNRFLCGSQITESDIRLFTTLVRFDSVYYTHFKTNLRRIIDYPNTWNYLKELYQMKPFGETVNFDHIKYHYFASHIHINPTGIVPLGPQIDFTQPHSRNQQVPL